MKLLITLEFTIAIAMGTFALVTAPMFGVLFGFASLLWLGSGLVNLHIFIRDQIEPKPHKGELTAGGEDSSSAARG